MGELKDIIREDMTTVEKVQSFDEKPKDTHGREGHVSIEKSITDIEADLYTICNIYFQAEAGYTDYDSKRNLSNINVEIGPRGKTHEVDGKLPLVLVSVNRKSWDPVVVGNMVNEHTPEGVRWNKARGSGTATIIVLSKSSVEVDQIASKLSFFLSSYASQIRSRFKLQLKGLDQSSPTERRLEGGKNVYTVVLSVPFVIEYNWTDVKIGKRLNSIFYKASLDGTDSEEYKYDIMRTKEILLNNNE